MRLSSFPRKHIGFLCVTVLLIAALMSVCAWWFWRHHLGNRDFEQLLSGAGDVAFISLEIDGQGMHIVLDDAESVNYLSDMVRSRSADPVNELGIGYHIYACFSTGSSVTFNIYMPRATDRIIIAYPIDSFGDGEVYLVVLRDPVPERLLGVLATLRDSSK